MKQLKFLIFILIPFYTLAQTPIEKRNLYTFFYNRVNDNYPFPLIGLYNQSQNDEFGVQIGLINRGKNNFSGVQIGGFNTIGNHQGGVQLGLINLAYEGNPFQFGIINVGGSFNKSFALQVGGWNYLYSIEETHGFQLGYFNFTDDLAGLQIGYFNMANKIRGVQFGLINFADSIERGVPIGFISFVKKGGYMSFEASASNILPAALAFKTGVNKLYSLLLAGYQNDFDNRVAFGWGMGSILPIYKTVTINPEYIYFSDLSPSKTQTRMLSFMLRWSFHRQMHLAIGPTLSFTTEKSSYLSDSETKVFVESGLRLAISYDLR